MDQTRSRINPQTRFRGMDSTLCMPAHCYFIPAVHAESRPATKLHPYKSGQAETANLSNQKNKIKHNKTKTNTLGSGLVAETEGGDEMERMISFISISFLNEIVL